MNQNLTDMVFSPPILNPKGTMAPDPEEFSLEARGTVEPLCPLLRRREWEPKGSTKKPKGQVTSLLKRLR